jgi:hypothetical protein
LKKCIYSTYSPLSSTHLFLLKPEDEGINFIRNFGELNIGLHNFRLQEKLLVVTAVRTSNPTAVY